MDAPLARRSRSEALEVAVGENGAVGGGHGWPRKKDVVARGYMGATLGLCQPMFYDIARCAQKTIAYGHLARKIVACCYTPFLRPTSMSARCRGPTGRKLSETSNGRMICARCTSSGRWYTSEQSMSFSTRFLRSPTAWSACQGSLWLGTRKHRRCRAPRNFHYSDHPSDVPCPLPRRIELVVMSIASPLTRPSPNGRRVGIRIVTFEACSGFTHVTARRIAQPPKGDLCDEAPALPVTRLSRSSASGSIDISPGGIFLH